MTEQTTSKLYQSIMKEPETVRELLQDWEGPALAAEKLAKARRIFLSGIGTSFHAATIGEYL
ncbi:MAG: hypothetical protein M3Z24_05670, partial [Chloroflexota bacterium]|nr:hypothetical protein [Chloroflexota bacterium]